MAICSLVIADFAVAQSTLVSRKEGMLRLFFDPSQRAVLESVRQGVVDRTIATRELQSVETTAIEVPDIVFNTTIMKEASTGRLIRERDLIYQGFIRGHGDSVNLLFDGEVIDDEALTQVEEAIGVDFSFEDSGENAGTILAEDILFKRRSSLERGDVLNADGTLGRYGIVPGQRFIIVKRDS